MIFDALCFALSGYFMKTSDDLMDEDNNLILAVITDILCAIISIYLSVNNADAACIFISIILGTGLALKIDSFNHILAAILWIVILIILGVPNFSFICLIICTIAVYLDEKGNDYVDEKEKKGMDLSLVDKLLKYRYVTKITVLILSLFGLINYIFPNSISWGLYFNPVTIVYFYLFDLSYEFSRKLTDIFNNIFKSFLGGF